MMNASEIQSVGPTEADLNSLLVRIEQLRKSTADPLNLPITQAPVVPIKEDILLRDVYQLQVDILSSFIAAAAEKNDDAIAKFISAGLTSPNARSSNGETGLLAAVRVGSVSTIRRLISLGASVNLAGRSPMSRGAADRTPLQLACMNGNLEIVKLLMEEYNADDSWMAPDGALARQLAIENGRSDVVTYLSGHNEHRQSRDEPKGMSNIIRIPLAIIVMIVYIIPRRIFFDLPKAAWKQRHRTPRTAEEHLRGPCQIFIHLIIFPLVLLYELPKQAVLSLKKMLRRGERSKGNDTQV